MLLISKFIEGFRFSLCILNNFNKSAWVVTSNDKKGVSIVNSFQKLLDGSNRKPKKIMVNKGSDFYNSSFRKWLKHNDIEMYSMHNEGKSVNTTGRFIRTSKTKIYKYMPLISKNVFINKLDDMLNKYNNTYHRTIKMKPFDFKDNTYIDSMHFNDKDRKFIVGDIVFSSDGTPLF